MAVTKYEFSLVRNAIEKYSMDQNPREFMDLMRVLDQLEEIIFVDVGGMH